jgi:hypothetical protein
VAYPVCTEGVYKGCTCTLPEDGELALLGDAGADSGCESIDVSDASGGQPLDRGGTPVKPSDDGPSGGPVDGPLFDVGDRGDCTGQVAKEVPAADCGDCSGHESFAYELCDGMYFSSCSCDLPPGYTLIN